MGDADINNVCDPKGKRKRQAVKEAPVKIERHCAIHGYSQGPGPEPNIPVVVDEAEDTQRHFMLHVRRRTMGVVYSALAKRPSKSAVAQVVISLLSLGLVAGTLYYAYFMQEDPRPPAKWYDIFADCK